MHPTTSRKRTALVRLSDELTAQELFSYNEDGALVPLHRCAFSSDGAYMHRADNSAMRTWLVEYLSTVAVFAILLGLVGAGLLIRDPAVNGAAAFGLFAAFTFAVLAAFFATRPYRRGGILPLRWRGSRELGELGENLLARIRASTSDPSVLGDLVAINTGLQQLIVDTDRAIGTWRTLSRTAPHLLEHHDVDLAEASTRIVNLSETILDVLADLTVFSWAQQATEAPAPGPRPSTTAPAQTPDVQEAMRHALERLATRTS